MGHPKNDNPQPSPTSLELLVQVMIPDKCVQQWGGKTKNEKQDAIKKGPMDLQVNMVWDTLLLQIAEPIQTEVENLIVGSLSGIGSSL
jgi:hypothetical protein